jgi:hypothetical protein
MKLESFYFLLIFILGLFQLLFQFKVLLLQLLIKTLVPFHLSIMILLIYFNVILLYFTALPNRLPQLSNLIEVQLIIVLNTYNLSWVISIVLLQHYHLVIKHIGVWCQFLNAMFGNWKASRLKPYHIVSFIRVSKRYLTSLLLCDKFFL